MHNLQPLPKKKHVLQLAKKEGNCGRNRSSMLHWPKPPRRTSQPNPPALRWCRNLPGFEGHRPAHSSTKLDEDDVIILEGYLNFNFLYDSINLSHERNGWHYFGDTIWRPNWILWLHHSLFRLTSRSSHDSLKSIYWPFQKAYGPPKKDKAQHLSHEKQPPTCHYTGWLIGILILAYYNPDITW